MKFLFLDDSIERHRVFRMINKDFDIDHCFYYNECIYNLACYDYDIVFLDCDLGIEKENGIDVCNWISENSHVFLKKPCFVIHSINHDGRKTMKKILASKGFQVSEYPYYRFLEK